MPGPAPAPHPLHLACLPLACTASPRHAQPLPRPHQKNWHPLWHRRHTPSLSHGDHCGTCRAGAQTILENTGTRALLLSAPRSLRPNILLTTPPPGGRSLPPRGESWFPLPSQCLCRGCPWSSFPARKPPHPRTPGPAMPTKDHTELPTPHNQSCSSETYIVST